MKFRIKKILCLMTIAILLGNTIVAFASEKQEAVLWSDLPNGKIVFDKCIDVIQMEDGGNKYIIEKDSSVEFLYNAYSISVFNAEEGMTDIIDDVTEKVKFNNITGLMHLM